MVKEIEIGKIYKDVVCNVFREVISIRGSVVAYWFADGTDSLKNTFHVGTAIKKHFIENNKEYKEPLTFKKIRAEKPSFIKKNNVHYKCVGFDFNGDLLCLTSLGTTITFKEEEIKDWGL